MSEPTAEKKRLPVWAIILIVVLIVAVAVLATVLIMNSRQKTAVQPASTAVQSSKATVAVNDEDDHEDVDSDDLVRPSSYVNEYTASVYRSDRSYINLRYGPDKTKYDVITTIDNGEKVSVESGTVGDGWVFVNYYGTEGWAKAEFLHK